ncbi:MAG: hypothetical protein HRU30_10785 [Rhodobacteraceae bacterium]|nr:hypothetical protein [Paracoccaceae bacterium]
MSIAPSLIFFLQVWGGVGAGVALLFLAWGIDRIDEDARGAYVFRVLIIPGILLIWPLVLWRWWQLEAQSGRWLARYQPVRRAHGLAALAMSVAIALIVFFGLSARQDWPADIAPVRVETGS